MGTNFNSLRRNMKFLLSMLLLTSAKTEEISEEYAAPQDGFCPLCSHGKGNLVECIKTAELVKCAEDEWCGLELKRRRGKMDKVTIGCKPLKLCESMMQQDIMERPIVDYPLAQCEANYCSACSVPCAGDNKFLCTNNVAALGQLLI